MWLVLALGCAAEPEPARPSVPRPNVLMVSIDTLRVDHLEHMPFLSSWLDASWTMKDHQQCSNWTWASVACTLGGKLPVEMGWVGNMRNEQRRVLPARVETLAERMAANGYHTVLISGNSWLSAEWDTDQGYAIWERGEDTPGDTLLKGLDFVPLQPWFLHVHLLNPHAPYDPPEAYLEGIEDLPPITYDLTTAQHYDALEVLEDLPEDERDAVEAHMRLRYRGEVAWLDDELARVLGGIDLDETLVVIWTDHGEQFWERGHATHAWDLGPEENDAILAFRGFGVAPREHTGPTHAIDLMPTVLDLAGLPIPRDLDGYVIGAAPDARLRFTSATARGGTIQAVTQGSYKLTFDWEGSLTLHDRAADPAELVDIYDPSHPAVAELWEPLRARAEALDALIPDEQPVWP